MKGMRISDMLCNILLFLNFYLPWKPENMFSNVHLEEPVINKILGIKNILCTSNCGI